MTPLRLGRHQREVSYLHPLAREIAAERPVAVAKVVEGQWAGAAVLAGPGGPLYADPRLEAAPAGLAAAMADLAAQHLVRGETGCQRLHLPAGSVRVYVESHLPPPVLLVVGAGHVGREVARAGALAGFQVWVLDDRREYAHPAHFPAAHRVICGPLTAELAAMAPGERHHVVLVTRGHAQDAACLAALAGRPVPYVGMIGSRTRVRTVLDALREEGVDEAWLSRVRAPIGLDIGARTPGEIAVAIAAELIAVRRGGTGRPLSALDRPLIHLSRR